MDVKQDFLHAKQKAIKALNKACKEKKVDSGILSLLQLINKSQEYYTSSSCAGRIILMEIPEIGDKKRAKMLGKWHRTINLEEITSSAEKAQLGQLWLLAQSPIIHVAANNNTNADKIVKIANASGFKNSGIKSIKNKNIIIEICSTERLDTPIGKNKKIFTNPEHLQLLIEIANQVITKSTTKLHRLEQNLRKCLSTHKTNPQ